ncbi:MAG: hypothetical protein HY904_11030 [Deltaproteobacteria bacterium]|nr:hypothetical protein [Deltaproteobacteria bacterium]
MTKQSKKTKKTAKPTTKQAKAKRRGRRTATTVVAALLSPPDLAARVAGLVGAAPIEAQPKGGNDAPRSGAHPKHPPCPRCGRALYKSMTPKAVKKSDPWAWCRNPACAAHNVDQSATTAATANAGGTP